MKNLLNEIKMTPTYLKQYASKTDARVGIEFELLNTNDTRWKKLQSIANSSVNSVDDLIDAAEQIIELFPDSSLADSVSLTFDTIQEEVNTIAEKLVDWNAVTNWLYDHPNYISDDIIRSTIHVLIDDDELDTDDADAVFDQVRSGKFDHNSDADKVFIMAVDTVAETAVDEQDKVYRAVYASVKEDATQDFLSNIKSVLHFFRNYLNVNLRDLEIVAEPLLGQVADDFTRQTGIQNVEYSGRYHGSRGHNGYRIEPDSSIKNADGSSGLGVEIISPPLTLSEMTEHVKIISNWAVKNGFETNSSTGLHINVSVPNIENLDYIKLVLLLGDEHVLNEFNRVDNEFAHSSFVKIQNAIDTLAGDHRFWDQLDVMKKQFVTDLHRVAKDVALRITNSKYVSVRLDREYVEFRSPGGDWLNMDLDRVLNTINRFVTVLSIACDPSAFREEYRKKFYNVIQTYFSLDNDTNSSNLIAGFVSGLYSKQALADRIQEITNNQIRNRIDQVKVDLIATSNYDNAPVFIVAPRSVGFASAVARVSLIVVANDANQIAKKYPNMQVIPVDHSKISNYVRRLINDRVEEFLTFGF